MDVEENNDVELVTLYQGIDLPKEDSKEHYKVIRSKFQNIEFELIDGGQSHCSYMISME